MNIFKYFKEKAEKKAKERQDRHEKYIQGLENEIGEHERHLFTQDCPIMKDKCRPTCIHFSHGSVERRHHITEVRCYTTYHKMNSGCKLWDKGE